MNERIKELMNQAMESTGVEGLGGSYMELNPGKFAELIVRECADIASINQHQYDAVGNYVLKHFGVEQ